MSGLPKIQQIVDAEAAIEDLTQKEAQMREVFEEDGLSAEEKQQLNGVKVKIDKLKATVAKLRKEMERNKRIWDKKAKAWDAYREKAGKLLAFDHRGAEKAVRLEVDIAEAEIMEHWADATMLLGVAETETAADWEDYEEQFPASQVYEAYLKDFRKRRDAAEGAENLTDEQGRVIMRLAETEFDAGKSAQAKDFVKANAMIATITEALLAVETELGMAPAANLSGQKWFAANQAKYPNSQKISDLESSFQADVTAFKKALEKAGVSISIGSTLRDTKRAALMHYAWKVGKKETKAADVPAIAGVDINFDHGADDLSVAKALEMVRCFDIVHEPSLTSNHTRGTAIDWDLSWSGDLKIKNKAGKDVDITSSPKTGQNTDLHDIGDGYGVKKLKKDPPHWSYNGN